MTFARWLASLLTLLVVLWPRHVDAESPSVPVQLQVELLAKIAAYDRNYPNRANGRARVGLVVRGSNPESIRVAAHLRSAFAHVPQLGGLPHEEIDLDYVDAPTLARACRAQKLTILYVTPGLFDDIEPIRRSLDGLDVLTVASTPEYVSRGIVLGTALVSGRPKILVNLAQARRHNVDFSSDLLRIALVYQ